MDQYRQLSAAIINLAMADLVKVINCKPGKVAEHALSAREFLLERNPDLEFWCSVGSLDMNVIVSKARSIVF